MSLVLDVTVTGFPGVDLQPKPDSGTPAAESAGDPGATAEEAVIAELHAEMADQLQRLAWAILRDWSLAADAVQETYVLCAARLRDIPADQRRGWLVKTVQYQAQNLRRKHRRLVTGCGVTEQGGELRDGDSHASRQMVKDWASEGRFSEDWASEDRASELQAERLAAMHAAIERLPAAQRSVVHARIHQQQTFQQIADASDLPLGTVLSRMRLAMQRLRKELLR